MKKLTTNFIKGDVFNDSIKLRLMFIKKIIKCATGKKDGIPEQKPVYMNIKLNNFKSLFKNTNFNLTVFKSLENKYEEVLEGKKEQEPFIKEAVNKFTIKNIAKNKLLFLTDIDNCFNVKDYDSIKEIGKEFMRHLQFGFREFYIECGDYYVAKTLNDEFWKIVKYFDSLKVKITFC